MMNPFTRVHRTLSEVFATIPEIRKGKNKSINKNDILFSAFAVFFTQSKSFLEYQHMMEAAEGRNNARSIFKIGRIPTDNHVRFLLDNYSPTLLYPIFDKLLVYLLEQRVLDTISIRWSTLLQLLQTIMS